MLIELNSMVKTVVQDLSEFTLNDKTFKENKLKCH